MNEKSNKETKVKKSEPKWTPDKSQILTIEESIRKQKEKKE